MTKRFIRTTTAFVFLIVAMSGANLLRTAHAQSGEDDVLSREGVWRDPEVPALGNPDGDVTVVEYFDYQCPICKVLHPQLSRTVREDGKVHLVSKNWPIFGGPSVYAARAFGFLGTPAFIVGTFRVEGGLRADGFKQVISEARAAQARH